MSKVEPRCIYNGIAGNWLVDILEPALGPIEEVLPTAKRWQKWWCLQILGRMASGNRNFRLRERIVDDLISQFASPSLSDVVAASDMFELVASTDALPALWTAARSKSDHVRYGAARGLEKIPDARSVPVLLTLLQDRSAPTAQAAISALGNVRLHDEQRVPVSRALERCSWSGDPDTVKRTLGAAGKQRFAWSNSRAQQLLKSRSRDVRRAANDFLTQ